MRNTSYYGLRRPTPPQKPYPPDSDEVELMDEDEGPFVCCNCVYYNGKDEPCIWQTEPLMFGKCCRRYWAVMMSERKQYEDLIKLRDGGE